VRREEHVLNGVFSYRYPGLGADHALVVQHGIGSHAGAFDEFSAHHAARGVDVWSMDAPGHGRSLKGRPPGRFTLDEWVQATVDLGEKVVHTSGLPVFVNGWGLGAAAAYGGLQASHTFGGAILMGYAIPSSPGLPTANPFRSEGYGELDEQWGDQLMLSVDRLIDFDDAYGYPGATEQMRADPFGTRFYDLRSFASFFRYDPVVPINENTKPIFYTASLRDPIFGADFAKAIAAETAGPVELHVLDRSSHQLMHSDTGQYSDLVLEWCLRQNTSSTSASP
jgi:pimeloyl-ACP methyl ester carboxylesterase